MQARASDAQKEAQVPGSPSRLLGLTVGTVLVILLLEHLQKEALEPIGLYLLRIYLRLGH
jgi:hypothetical protein